jgi:hypothetical protein
MPLQQKGNCSNNFCETRFAQPIKLSENVAKILQQIYNKSL